MTGCSTDGGDGTSGTFSYPYVYTELEYLGKANLSTSYPWPTDTEVGDELRSVIQDYIATHPSTDDDAFEFDGVIYEMDESSITAITGGVPQVVFDSFWKDLKSYAAGLWSCWGYVYCSIPSKGATSQAYIIYAICDDKYASTQNQIKYFAAKGTIKQSQKRHITGVGGNVTIPTALSALGMKK